MDKQNQILTVSEITKEIRRTLEESFEQVSVIGEISNFKSHISGHWYFSLKDSDAVINCTMWKGFNQYVFLHSARWNENYCEWKTHSLSSTR